MTANSLQLSSYQEFMFLPLNLGGFITTSSNSVTEMTKGQVTSPTLSALVIQNLLVLQTLLLKLTLGQHPNIMIEETIQTSHLEIQPSRNRGKSSYCTMSTAWPSQSVSTGFFTTRFRTFLQIYNLSQKHILLQLLKIFTKQDQRDTVRQKGDFYFVFYKSNVWLNRIRWLDSPIYFSCSACCDSYSGSLWRNSYLYIFEE